ncbi:glycosyltransferase [Weissella viridescens]|uniref:Glycosyltransferase n=1 Tax=Weissella viridescens TaxID=1629 RepID=A0A3P2RE24_WEIVI|nr:glycosyltransferase [Weissella viridescens]
MSKKKRMMYLFSCLLTVFYLVWRVFFTLPWHASYWLIAFAIILVVCEIMSNCTAYLTIFLRLRVSKHDLTQHLDELDYPEGADLPNVDIVIVTHDESVELLRKTVNAAVKQQYGNQAGITVCIADDGNRPEVAELAASYGAKYVGFAENTEAKSGNINHALAQLSAPLVAIFDADMIPYSTFLNASVPPFLENWHQRELDQNEKPLGFLQTPQSFYNADIFQYNLFSENIVPNEQDYFSRDINVLNSANGAAIFTGSNALFLREAIDAAGGFPTDTLTEDFELGARINLEGYMSYSTQEPQASGLSPSDLKGVITQRKRWARGVIQSCRNLHIFTNRHFSIVNRLILINSYLYWWSFFRRLIFIMAPILFALFNQPVVMANFWLLMCFWAPGHFLQHWVLGDTSGPIRNERWGEVQETFFAPFLVLPVLFESLGLKEKKFIVTDKSSKTTWQDRLYILPYLILWVLILMSLIQFNYGKFGSEILYGSVITFWLLTHFINLTFCLFIASGRPLFRSNERFSRSFDGTMQLGRLTIDLQTVDLSDTAIKFKLRHVQTSLIKPGEMHTITLYDNDDEALPLQGRILRVFDLDGVQHGVIQILEADQLPEHLNAYLRIVYDGSNANLTDEQDKWITPLDELWLNLMNRFENWRKRMNRHLTGKTKRGKQI